MKAVDVVELAYRGRPSTKEWLVSLLRGLPWIGSCSSAFAYQVDISAPTTPKITNHVSLFGACDRQWVSNAHRALIAANGMRRLYRQRFTTARSTFGANHPMIKFLASTGFATAWGCSRSTRAGWARSCRLSRLPSSR